MENDNNQKMDKNHKRALLILSIFSVAIITIWFVNFFHILKKPFNYEYSSNNNTNNSTSTTSENSSNSDLKLVDTDSDGLSDWDELFTYGTSPYLEDTDSDELTDYEEVMVYKTDPSCLEGQVCSGTLNQSDSQVVNNTSEVLDNYYQEVASTSENTITTEDISAYLNSGSVDVSYLRQLLLEEGFSQSDLEKISDEDLVSAYKDVVDKL
jgi:hypothetical protein